MKTKPGTNCSFYQISVEIEGEKKNAVFLFLSENLTSPRGQHTVGKRGAFNLLRPHRNFAPIAFRAAVK